MEKREKKEEEEGGTAGFDVLLFGGMLCFGGVNQSEKNREAERQGIAVAPILDYLLYFRYFTE